MENLQDFYTDARGRRFEPKNVGQNWVYLRADWHGHIFNLVCPLKDGTPDFDKGKFYREKYEALGFIYREEKKHPETYITKRAREILKQYGK